MLKTDEILLNNLVFINGIKFTEHYYGSNDAMMEMIGKTYKIISWRFNMKGIILDHHSNGRSYTFRVDDLKLAQKQDKEKVTLIKVHPNRSISAKFDVTTLIT